jgi:ribosomal-protein-alanine N-acetyltransferase
MLEVSFNPFPVLETERLYLREITALDVNEVFALRSNPVTMQYIPRPLAKTQQDALDHINMISKGVADNDLITWAIALKEDNRLIGMICLLRMQLKNFRTEIGYILHPSFHGQRLIDESIKRVISYAFDTLKFHSIEAIIDPANSASEKVLLRNHFIKEGHLEQNEFYNGRFLNTVIYSLINKNSPWV